MNIKVWVITESYFDYKGADATTHGIYKSMKDAKVAFRDILHELFEYVFEEQDDAENEKWIMTHYVKNTKDFCEWVYDDGDSLYKFYIEEMSVEI